MADRRTGAREVRDTMGRGATTRTGTIPGRRTRLRTVVLPTVRPMAHRDTIGVRRSAHVRRRRRLTMVLQTITSRLLLRTTDLLTGLRDIMMALTSLLTTLQRNLITILLTVILMVTPRSHHTTATILPSTMAWDITTHLRRHHHPLMVDLLRLHLRRRMVDLPLPLHMATDLTTALPDTPPRRLLRRLGSRMRPQWTSSLLLPTILPTTVATIPLRRRLPRSFSLLLLLITSLPMAAPRTATAPAPP
jgi:hypothetical protein